MSVAGATRNKELASFRTRLFTAIMVISSNVDCARILSGTAQSHRRR